MAGREVAGHYSTAASNTGRQRPGTTIVFTQTGVPASNAKSIDTGWATHLLAADEGLFRRRDKVTAGFRSDPP
jgi:hypothetical protein